MLPSPDPRFHYPSHRLKSEPIQRLESISGVLLKEPHQEAGRFMRWGHWVQIESILRNLSLRFPFPLLLICVGEAEEVEFLWLPHHIPTVWGSESSNLQHTGVLSEAGPQGSCPFYLPMQFPETSLNGVHTSCGLETLYYVRFICPAEFGVTAVGEMVLCISSYPTGICQNLKVTNGWLFAVW